MVGSKTVYNKVISRWKHKLRFLLTFPHQLWTKIYYTTFIPIKEQRFHSSLKRQIWGMLSQRMTFMLWIKKMNPHSYFFLWQLLMNLIFRLKINGDHPKQYKWRPIVIVTRFSNLKQKVTVQWSLTKLP